MTPEEVAGVLAEHAGEIGVECSACDSVWLHPCLPYRLASLASEQAAAIDALRDLAADAIRGLDQMRAEVEHQRDLVETYNDEINRCDVLQVREERDRLASLASEQAAALAQAEADRDREAGRYVAMRADRDRQVAAFAAEQEKVQRVKDLADAYDLGRDIKPMLGTLAEALRFTVRG